MIIDRVEQAAIAETVALHEALQTLTQPLDAKCDMSLATTHWLVNNIENRQAEASAPMVDRIPPPPFWRTRYFAEIVVTKPIAI